MDADATAKGGADMAVYSLVTPTAVAVGAAVPYDIEVIKGCCNIKRRPGAGTVNVKGNCCNPNKYKVNFHGNVTGVAGAISLGIYEDGELIRGTEMNVKPVATGDVWSVDAETVVKAECNCDAISVRVITGATVTVNSATLVVEKVV